MEKIHRSKFYTYFIPFFIVMNITIMIFWIFVICDSAAKNNIPLVMIGSFVVVLFALFLVFGCFVFNRVGAIIYYDSENGVLIRKGYIYGFESTVKVDDIKRVEKVYLYREGTFYVLIDEGHSKYDGLYVDSYFCIECSKESKEFIEKFWDGELESFIY